jgi:hypothetical protein
VKNAVSGAAGAQQHVVGVEVVDVLGRDEVMADEQGRRRLPAREDAVADVEETWGPGARPGPGVSTFYVTRSASARAG